MGWNKFFLLLLSALWCATTEAQTFDDWFRQKKTQIKYYVEQIGALRAYGELVVKGYGVVNDGLELVHDIRDGEFSLHNDYFTSLSGVNDHLRTPLPAGLYTDIVQQCNATSRLSEQLTASQQHYVASVISNLEGLATTTRRKYELLTSSGEYALNDSERTNRITAAVEVLQDQYAFIRRFYQKAQRMVVQQQKEQSDAKSLEKIYK